jgi:hypothetical protein
MVAHRTPEVPALLVVFPVGRARFRFLVANGEP